MDTLLVERRDGVVWLTLDRPEKKNAISNAMWYELIAVFDEVSASRDDRALVVTGAGDAFCSGADLSGVRSGDPAIAAALSGPGGSLANMRLVGRCALRLHEVPKPTIAAVNGIAAGAGCNLALGCDLVIASERARFSELFVHRGLSVDFGGSWLLPRLIGLHKAKELAFLGEIVDAREAERMGIVNQVVPADELAATVTRLADRLAHLPPLALSLTKRLLNQSFALAMNEALDAEGIAQSLNSRSPDTMEAMRAFLEKREPVFTGE